MAARRSGRGSVARAPGYEHRGSVSARLTCRQSRNFQRTWHFIPRMNIFANFGTIDSRMIKGAFFCLKMKTIADNPHDAGRIDARETLTFHPHHVKQRACRRLRNLVRRFHGPSASCSRASASERWIGRSAGDAKLYGRAAANRAFSAKFTIRRKTGHWPVRRS